MNFQPLKRNIKNDQNDKEKKISLEILDALEKFIDNNSDLSMALTDKSFDFNVSLLNNKYLMINFFFY
jgi:hypothetical protein